MTTLNIKGSVVDNLISPTLNINGSSADDLIQPRHDAYCAITALQRVTPNRRDYPGQPDQCDADRQTHYARIKVLHSMAFGIVIEAADIKEQTK
jgi:hypothetical protein